jgi:hypothetical protein
MTKHGRVERCRDCHWWGALDDDDRQNAEQWRLCHAWRRVMDNENDSSVDLYCGITSPNDFCPKFQRWDGGRVFRPDVCGGCYNAKRVLEEIHKAIRGDNWDVKDMLSSEAYREREEAHNRVYKRVDELIQMLVTSTETSE